MGKVIHLELGKELKFDPITKWYMHEPEFVQENEMRKILLDFEIQTDPLNPARQSDLALIKKKLKKSKKLVI